MNMSAVPARVTKTNTVVSFRGIEKSYGAFQAVAALSLDIRQGELVCLLGPSGCGKTTTLRMLAGFVEPSAGEIWLDEDNVTRVPAYRRDVGIVFQNYALFPHMTVAKNVEYGLVNINMPKAARQARIAEVLRRVELQHLADRYPRALSGGQQQRVALARALALQPKVLLLDEPFSNLDAQLRVRLREELSSLIRGLDMTTLFVTHDQEEALTLADRIVVMNKGAVEQIGTPEEIYDSPQTRFVAEFIGTCSLLEGRVDEGGDFLSERGLRFPVARRPGAATAIIRPEYVRHAAEAPGAPVHRAVVETSEYMGAATRLQLRVGDARLLMDGRYAPGRRPRAGDEIDIVIDPTGVRFVTDGN
ncbi:ABC transporter ATP-binding protein [Siccirubricoccus sp. KC 17139]|uniref:ABC transporter ATP-binding protein n=1 Tax=Siccirubricoccus soli TaxID=2899147 RepID=A0ABT1DF37_9PROT|nr:ABC transporter ATP-binding protein [Siccirubricoccus soli]MCO6419830.1 ABC transporter ATP-binding protein [Siccirubricoccus soli]MCP2685965.1 ABC transporter ATP-binding protein [Siccirubricoccus soli]